MSRTLEGISSDIQELEDLFLDDDDDQCHFYCETCYPDASVAFCGKDISGDVEIPPGEEVEICTDCERVENSFPLNEEGYPICPVCGT
jgi:hypothetical protein